VPLLRDPTVCPADIVLSTLFEVVIIIIIIIIIITIIIIINNNISILVGAWGSVVVEALHYQSDDPGINSRWCHWIFQ
jgi:hypothetical protein